MKKIIFIYITVLLIFTSCSSDFTELSPEDYPKSQEFYKTQNDFNAAVLAAYAKLQSQLSTIYVELEYRSDNLNVNAPTAGAQDRYDLNQFKETTANTLVQDFWANLYNGIFRCNVITDRIGSAKFDLKNQFEAEARFIRAMSYFNVVRMWGDAPLVLTEIRPDEALKIGRSPVSKIYEAIEKDLLFAIDNLPASYPSKDFGRATSGAARALLGKVYLTEKKYPEAVATLNEVIGKYSLLPNVKTVFDTSKKTNAEIIFSIRFDKEIAGEGHALIFGLSDVSTRNTSSKLENAFDPLDTRLFLITYQPNGKSFAPGKFLDALSSSTKVYGNDYILLRYADVLLMLAEAINEQDYSTSGNAYTYLNAVRTRAGLNALTSTELTDQASFRTAVLKERFLEFPLEGQRWFDLIRTKTAKDELAKLGKTIGDHQLLFPIPQAEIEKVNNLAIFAQNPGY